MSEQKMIKQEPILNLPYIEKDGIKWSQLPERKDNKPLNRWGKQALRYMQETNPTRVMILNMKDELMPILRKVETEATEKMDNLQDQLLKQYPAPSGEDDYMKRVQHFYWIRNTAEEIVLKEIVNVPH